MNFWDKVAECKHENMYPDYYEDVSCGTPYCGGWESHCKDCGVFIADCKCGFVRGLSGWPMAGWRRFRRKKENKRREAARDALSRRT